MEGRGPVSGETQPSPWVSLLQRVGESPSPTTPQDLKVSKDTNMEVWSRWECLSGGQLVGKEGKGALLWLCRAVPMRQGTCWAAPHSIPAPEASRGPSCRRTLREGWGWRLGVPRALRAPGPGWADQRRDSLRARRARVLGLRP